MTDHFSRTRVLAVALKLRELTKQFAERDQPVQKGFDTSHNGVVKEAMSQSRLKQRYPDAEAKIREGVLTRSSIIFKVDLSPFSTFVATAQADDIHALLDDYYRWAVSLVEQHGGVVEKYIGDAVLAVFGEPFVDDVAQSTCKAVAAARVLIEEAHAKYHGEMGAKVAIARGPCYLGVVGPQEHLDLTVVGNPLTTAFRLEAEAKKDEFLLPVQCWNDVVNGGGMRIVSGGADAKWAHATETIPIRGTGVVLEVVRVRRKW